MSLQHYLQTLSVEHGIEVKTNGRVIQIELPRETKISLEKLVGLLKDETNSQQLDIIATQLQFIYLFLHGTTVLVLKVDKSSPLPNLTDIYSGSEILEYQVLKEIKKTSRSDGLDVRREFSTLDFTREGTPSEQIGTHLFSDGKIPLELRVHLDGNQITDIRMVLNFNYRGIESRICDSTSNTSELIERICGLCSVSHQIAYAGVQSSQLNITGQDLLVLELERIKNHLMWTAFTCNLLGLSELFHRLFSLRQKMEKMQPSLGFVMRPVVVSGQKIEHFTGTKDRRISFFQDVKSVIQEIQDELQDSEAYALLKSQLQVSTSWGSNIGAVGPLARSAGVEVDGRTVLPIYNDLRFTPLVLHDNDLASLTRYKLEEAHHSIKLCIDILIQGGMSHYAEFLPYHLGDIKISLVEAPAGLLSYTAMFSDDRMQKLGIRIPTVRNIPGMLDRLNGAEVKYLPLVLRHVEMGFDPLEHVVFVNDAGDTRQVSGDVLRQQSTKALISGFDLEIF